MKSISLFFLVAILLSFGCAPPASEPTAETPAIDLDSERDALMAVDKAWVWHKQADGSWKVQVGCFNANGPTAAGG